MRFQAATVVLLAVMGGGSLNAAEKVVVDVYISGRDGSALLLGPGMPLWKIAATFVGVLWVVALSEEFFFRGLLQQWIGEWTGRPALGLAAASIVFGAVHLGFRAFPNWKFALAAAVAGWFYGRAYRQAQSIRASMVTHALVVTLWRAFFV